MWRTSIWIPAIALLAACAHKPPEPVVVDSLVSSTATVEEIHTPSRMVLLRTEDGDRTAVKVGPNVRNFDEVQVGDRVTVSYYTGIAAEVKKPGTPTRDDSQERKAAVRDEPGMRPAGAVADSVQATVKIESVDKANNRVKFRRQDGLIRTLDVQTPEGRKFLQGLRPGDEVEVTYTEALAIDVRPAG
ncbi:MAG TPA: hypothetical protein VIL32_04525 [Steroidobacteraceae bacterium]